MKEINKWSLKKINFLIFVSYLMLTVKWEREKENLWAINFIVYKAIKS